MGTIQSSESVAGRYPHTGANHTAAQVHQDCIESLFQNTFSSENISVKINNEFEYSTVTVKAKDTETEKNTHEHSRGRFEDSGRLFNSALETVHKADGITLLTPPLKNEIEAQGASPSCSDENSEENFFQRSVSRNDTPLSY